MCFYLFVPETSGEEPDLNLKKDSSLPYGLQSMLLWAFVPVLWSFLPVYLAQSRFSPGQIGTVMAVNPFVSLIVQPLLGPAADRAKSKNRFFSFMILGSILFILLLPLAEGFKGVMLLVTVISVFQVAAIPVSESISLELLDRIRRPYGPVRLMGNVGFMLTSVAMGYLISVNVNNLFIAAALLGVLNVLIIHRLPLVGGHQSRKGKVGYREVFRDVRLRVFVTLSIIPHLSNALYMTYLPMFLMSIGGVESQLGWIYFIMAASDFPFLLYAERIIRRVGIQRALGFSVFSFGLRFLVLLLISAPVWIFLLSLFHGFTFMIFGFGLAVYMNQSVRPELKTTGQSVLAVANSAGRIIGTFAGGQLIASYGMKTTFVSGGILCFGTLAVYSAVMYLLRHKIVISAEESEGSLSEIMDGISGSQMFE